MHNMTITGCASMGVAGSGTTGAAAIRSGMSFLGCEMSAEYHERALERLRAEESGSTSAGSRAGQLALMADPSPGEGKVTG